jgi:hypothetical protein
VSLVDDVLRALPEFRAAAEALMVDACTVTRPGESITDPETGEVTPSLTDVYSGPCKVQQTISQASNPTAGSHAFTVQDSRVDFPVSAGPLAVDDVVTITSSALDPQLVGTVFRVVELFHKSMATAQRTRVEQVTE